MQFSNSSIALHLPAQRQDSQARTTAPSAAPMYTPRWHAEKVLATTAHSWWEGGVPPARGRRLRAANAAVSQAAAGVARRLHLGRPGRPA